MTIAGGSCSESAASGGRRERVVVLCCCRQPGDETCRVSLLVRAPRFCFVFCEFWHIVLAVSIRPSSSPPSFLSSLSFHAAVHKSLSVSYCRSMLSMSMIIVPAYLSLAYTHIPFSRPHSTLRYWHPSHHAPVLTRHVALCPPSVL